MKHVGREERMDGQQEVRLYLFRVEPSRFLGRTCIEPIGSSVRTLHVSFFELTHYWKNSRDTALRVIFDKGSYSRELQKRAEEDLLGERKRPEGSSMSLQNRQGYRIC